jgi:hypothetical protein
MLKWRPSKVFPEIKAEQNGKRVYTDLKCFLKIRAQSLCSVPRFAPKTLDGLVLKNAVSSLFQRKLPKAIKPLRKSRIQAASLHF